jgi:hypothetical protein
MGRLAAAFNGGFQATHGEFGMMADRVVYLPPKPYAATIAELDDGSAGFGTWPDNDAIGNEFVGFRQNLTPLLSDGKDNPYERTWWGGVPPGWQDATRTVRTGLCLTRESHLAYFYGSSIDMESLTVAMNAARCRYGVHLDMNPGHTGLEFYRVGLRENLPNLARKLDSSWEAKGAVSDMAGWEFLGRRMIRSMHLMNFPRYARTDSRDFFYLTHRQLLTTERLNQPNALMQPKGIEWRSNGLPQHGFPPALAMGRITPEPSRPNLLVSVVLLDGKWAKPCLKDCGSHPTLLTTKAPLSFPELQAVYANRAFRIENVPAPEKANSGKPDDPTSIVVASGRSKTHVSAVRAALGTTDGQWLYYVEVTAGADPAHDVTVLARLLDEFGCRAQLFLDRPLGLSLDNTASEEPSAAERLTWFRDDAPLARRILEKTPVVPQPVWYPLQSKRIRYKRQRSTASAEDTSGRNAATPQPVPSQSLPLDAAQRRATPAQQPHDAVPEDALSD